MRKAWLAGLAALAPLMAAAAPATGDYDNGLMLGYDPASGVVSGYFSMTEDRPPVFSCLFAIRGKLAGASAAVDTYDPADPKGDLIRGTLSVEGKAKVRIVLPTDHGGCGNLWPFADQDNPADFDLATARPWTAVRVVKSARAYLYPQAGVAQHGKAYVVRGDGVGVLAARSGWIEAEYTGGKKPISGWLPESDIYP